MKKKFFSEHDNKTFNDNWKQILVYISPNLITLTGSYIYINKLLAFINIQNLNCFTNKWLCSLFVYSNFINSSIVMCFLCILLLFSIYSKFDFIFYMSIFNIMLSFLCFVLSYIFLLLAFSEGSSIKYLFSDTPIKWLTILLLSFTSKYCIFTIFFYSFFTIIFAFLPTQWFYRSRNITTPIFNVNIHKLLKTVCLIFFVINTFIPSFLFLFIGNDSLISFSLK